MKKIFNNSVFTFILGVILTTTITSVLAFSIFSNDVGFTPTDNSWKKEDGSSIENVSDALDSLYKINNGYTDEELKKILDITGDKVDINDVLTTNFMSKISSNKAAAKKMMDSTYFRNKVNVTLLNALKTALVPTLSNNTNVIYSTEYSSNWAGWKAFIEASESWCNVNGKTTNQYIGYKFNTNVNVRITKFLNGGPQSYQAKTVRLQASNDNSTWVDASDNYTLANTNSTVYLFNTKLDESYQYWRVFIVNIYSSSYVEIGGLQFYGV
ncbi:MAG: hypothetical protein IJ572_00760 [Bacilli bacterium]|nr:hypothetical protein [Bacilli bacterium]